MYCLNIDFEKKRIPYLLKLIKTINSTSKIQTLQLKNNDRSEKENNSKSSWEHIFFDSLLEDGKEISTLQLDSFTLSESGLPKIFKTLPDLRSLSLSNCLLSTRLKNFPFCLSSLHLSHMKLSPTQFQQLFLSLSTLSIQSLSINYDDIDSTKLLMLKQYLYSNSTVKVLNLKRSRFCERDYLLIFDLLFCSPWSVSTAEEIHFDELEISPEKKMEFASLVKRMNSTHRRKTKLYVEINNCRLSHEGISPQFYAHFSNLFLPLPSNHRLQKLANIFFYCNVFQVSGVDGNVLITAIKTQMKNRASAFVRALNNYLKHHSNATDYLQDILKTYEAMQIRMLELNLSNCSLNSSSFRSIADILRLSENATKLIHLLQQNDLLPQQILLTEQKRLNESPLRFSGGVLEESPIDGGHGPQSKEKARSVYLVENLILDDNPQCEVFDMKNIFDLLIKKTSVVNEYSRICETLVKSLAQGRAFCAQIAAVELSEINSDFNGKDTSDEGGEMSMPSSPSPVRLRSSPKVQKAFSQRRQNSNLKGEKVPLEDSMHFETQEDDEIKDQKEKDLYKVPHSPSPIRKRTYSARASPNVRNYFASQGVFKSPMNEKVQKAMEISETIPTVSLRGIEKGARVQEENYCNTLNNFLNVSYSLGDHITRRVSIQNCLISRLHLQFILDYWKEYIYNEIVACSETSSTFDVSLKLLSINLQNNYPLNYSNSKILVLMAQLLGLSECFIDIPSFDFESFSSWMGETQSFLENEEISVRTKLLSHLKNIFEEDACCLGPPQRGSRESLSHSLFNTKTEENEALTQSPGECTRELSKSTDLVFKTQVNEYGNCYYPSDSKLHDICQMMKEKTNPLGASTRWHHSQTFDIKKPFILESFFRAFQSNSFIYGEAYENHFNGKCIPKISQKHIISSLNNQSVTELLKCQIDNWERVHFQLPLRWINSLVKGNNNAIFQALCKNSKSPVTTLSCISECDDSQYLRKNSIKGCPSSPSILYEVVYDFRRMNSSLQDLNQGKRQSKQLKCIVGKREEESNVFINRENVERDEQFTNNVTADLLQYSFYEGSTTAHNSPVDKALADIIVSDQTEPPTSPFMLAEASPLVGEVRDYTLHCNHSESKLENDNNPIVLQLFSNHNPNDTDFLSGEDEQEPKLELLVNNEGISVILKDELMVSQNKEELAGDFAETKNTAGQNNMLPVSLINNQASEDIDLKENQDIYQEVGDTDTAFINRVSNNVTPSVLAKSIPIKDVEREESSLTSVINLTPLQTPTRVNPTNHDIDSLSEAKMLNADETLILTDDKKVDNKIYWYKKMSPEKYDVSPRWRDRDYSPSKIQRKRLDTTSIIAKCRHLDEWEANDSEGRRAISPNRAKAQTTSKLNPSFQKEGEGRVIETITQNETSISDQKEIKTNLVLFDTSITTKDVQKVFLYWEKKGLMPGGQYLKLQEICLYRCGIDDSMLASLMQLLFTIGSLGTTTDNTSPSHISNMSQLLQMSPVSNYSTACSLTPKTPISRKI